MRTALQLLAEQQVQLDAEKKAVSAIAARLEMRPVVAQIRHEATQRVAALRAQADAENPAQPWPSEGTESPAATTDETLGDVNSDSVEQPGSTSETNVAPATTTSVDSVGQDIAPAPAASQDVTKTVSGTEGKQPLEDVRIETEIEVKDGVNPETAFPLEGDFAQKPTLGSVPTEGRQFASLRLAKVRIAAGVADTQDDLDEATKIASSDLTDEAIASEIAVLDKVVSARPRQAPSVPRTASRAPQQQRSQPSMAGGLSAVGVGGGGFAPSGDEFLFD